MTLHTMHKRAEAGRRGEFAARYAAAHEMDALLARADPPDAKADPPVVPPGKGELRSRKD